MYWDGILLNNLPVAWKFMQLPKYLFCPYEIAYYALGESDWTYVGKKQNKTKQNQKSIPPETSLKWVKIDDST